MHTIDAKSPRRTPHVRDTSTVEIVRKNCRSLSMAGCISLHKNKKNFGLPFGSKDFLMPIGENINALQRAVMECCLVGCDSIWISCDYSDVALARAAVGEFVYDPRELNPLYPIRFDKMMMVPIFFVPMNVADLSKRDSLSWGIINSAYNAVHVGKKVSTFLRPDKFYVAFVQGAYSPWTGMRMRKKASSLTRTFHYQTEDGRTFKDNEYLGFTFTYRELMEIRRTVFTLGTKRNIFTGNPKKYLEQKKEFLIKRPMEEAWSARRFEIADVFECVKIEDGIPCKLRYYFNIENWDGYKKLMSISPEFKLSRRTPTSFLQPGGKIQRMGFYDRTYFEHPHKSQVDERSWIEGSSEELQKRKSIEWEEGGIVESGDDLILTAEDIEEINKEIAKSMGEYDPSEYDEDDDEEED